SRKATDRGTTEDRAGQRRSDPRAVQRAAHAVRQKQRRPSVQRRDREDARTATCANPGHRQADRREQTVIYQYTWRILDENATPQCICSKAQGTALSEVRLQA